MRIAFVSSYAAPFHVPPLNALAKTCELSVLFLDDTRSHDVSHRSIADFLEADTTIGRSRHIQLDDSDMAVKFTLGSSRWLAAKAPEAVVVLSFVPSMWEPIVWARRHHIPLVMWSESTSWSGKKRGRASQAMRRRVVRSPDSHLSNGSQTSAFLEELGISKSSIVEASFPIIPPAISIPRGHGTESGISTRSLRVLFVGRLIPRKRPLDAIAAVEKVNGLSDSPVAELRVVGDGPLVDEVRALADGSSYVEWLGRQSGDMLQRQYDWADVLVVPSDREVWGLVVNEALASGLYVLSTDRVGSAIDLVESTGNGRFFRVGDVDALTQLLFETAATLETGIAARSERSERAIAWAPTAYRPDCWADAMVEAVELARFRRRDG